MRQKPAGEKLQCIVYWLVLISFMLPVVFLIFRLITLDSAAVPSAGYRSRADYSLMLIQCLLGIAVIHVPALFKRKFGLELPAVLYIEYVIFLYCAIFLGEVRSFYYRIPHWDVILHCFSSVMAGSFGFIVVALLNQDEHITLSLSPVFVAIFAFCFAIAIGAVWEIYEFVFDGLLGLNMQKFILPDGTVLAGQDALRDTMEDLIVDCAGALFASVSGYFSIKKGSGWLPEAFRRQAKKKRK